MCILKLMKVLMYEFYFDYIENKYVSKSKLLFKLKMSMKILAAIKKCLTLVTIRLSQNTMMVQTNLSLQKRKTKQEVLQLKNYSD